MKVGLKRPPTSSPPGQGFRFDGYEAYEFHDRYASIVTGELRFGRYARPDGRTEINPKIHKIMQVFGAQSITLPSQAAPASCKRWSASLRHSADPRSSPKRSISTAEKQGVVGGRWWVTVTGDEVERML